jgi:hypothetical protein
LRKLSIAKEDDKIDEISDTEKNITRTIKFNEIDYTELIHSMNVQAIYGKIVFNNVKRCKNKRVDMQ